MTICIPVFGWTHFFVGLKIVLDAPDVLSTPTPLKTVRGYVHAVPPMDLEVVVVVINLEVVTNRRPFDDSIGERNNLGLRDSKYCYAKRILAQ